MACCSTFSSSRMFPGQSCARAPASEPAVRRSTGRPSFRPRRSDRWRTSTGRSSRRSSKRRQRDGEHVEPVEQVAPEPAGAHLVGEVAIGRGHDAHVDWTGCGAAEPLDLPSWSTRSSFGCSSSGSSPISSRKSVPPLASSNAPGLRRVRAGERAALVAEELALDQRRRERGAVDDHEAAGAAAGCAGGWRGRPAPCRCPSRRAGAPCRGRSDLLDLVHDRPEPITPANDRGIGPELIDARNVSAPRSGRGIPNSCFIPLPHRVFRAGRRVLAVELREKANARQ